MVCRSNPLKLRIKHLIKEERGQALTEFALIAPILIAIAIGILLLGYYIYCHIIVVSAANQGARTGSALMANPDSNSQEAFVKAKNTAESVLSQGLNINNGNVSIQQHQSFDVTVYYDFRFPITLPGLPSSQTISYTASYMIWGDT